MSARKMRGDDATTARALDGQDDLAADRILRASFWSSRSSERELATVIDLHTARTR